MNKPVDTSDHDLEAQAQEAAWLVETGDQFALEAHLAAMSDEHIAQLLGAVFDRRLQQIWNALPDDRKATINALLAEPVRQLIRAPEEIQAGTTLRDQLFDVVDHGDSVTIETLIAEMPAEEIADALEAMPDPGRGLIWQAIPDDLRADVLSGLDEGVRVSLLGQMTEADILPLVENFDHGDLLDVVEGVSAGVADAILSSLPVDELALMEARRAYAEDSAGRLMEVEWTAVRANVTLEVVVRYLKRLGKLPAHTDGLMVVDREGHYLGKLPVATLLTQNDTKRVEEVMEANADWVTTDTDQNEVADLFERRELTSVAVVDGEHKLIGRITLDDIIDVIREAAEAPLLHMAGLDEGEDLFAPIVPSARRRMFWLGINLATAFLAAYVIGLFEATLDQIVALAVLMPIVASMGGIAGSQTLTLAIRGMALGQISDANTRWLATKELAIAGINGVVWALVVGAMAWLWFGDLRISAVIGAAMLINQFAAAAAGIAVPITLDKFGIDPALSGSVILTTVTDVVGFMSFLGLATIVLL